jgi:prepilin-type N-terminal cleavage/methylation domain-containing protein
MTAERTRCRGRTGFSLIEVLMAVFILALGLLGLGAVFPVVIREQRQGHDTVLGTTAAASARALLQGYDYSTTLGNVRDMRDFWTRIRDDASYGLRHPDYRHGEWLVAEAESAGNVPGQIKLVGGGAQLTLRLANRLWPSPPPTPNQAPLFVWDFAVHRVVDGTNFYEGHGVRVAIFVRRLDPRIRVHPRENLYRQLTDPNSEMRRVPVAVDEDGLPTYDGVGEPALHYANLRKVRVEFRTARPEDAARDRLYFDTSDPEGGNPQRNVPWRLARQVGQKLVDNLGNIYTVIEVGKASNGDEYVRVSPPVPATVPPSADVSRNSDLPCIREVLLSPQIPAAVLLWRVVQ